GTVSRHEHAVFTFKEGRNAGCFHLCRVALIYKQDIRTEAETQSTDSEDRPFYSITLWSQHPPLPNGTFWNVQRPMPESLGLDVRCPDHLGPHLDLGRDAGRELLRRARDHVVAKGSEPLLHVRLREDFGALAVKDRDNLRRGAGGNKDAHPTIAFDLGVARLRHGRHVGENLRARLTGDRERTHSSFPAVLHGRLRRDEADRRVTRDNCGDRRPAAPEGNMDEVEAQREPELLAGKMRLRASPR